jgi:hypothetical protein
LRISNSDRTIQLTSSGGKTIRQKSDMVAAKPGADVFFASAAHKKPAHKQPSLEGHACWLRRHPRLLAPPSSVRISQAASAPLAPLHCGPQPLGACSLPARRLGPSRQPVNPPTPLSRRLGSKSPQAGRLPAGSGRSPHSLLGPSPLPCLAAWAPWC